MAIPESDAPPECRVFRPSRGIHDRVKITELPGPLRVATDGSCKGNCIAWGYVAGNGQWGCAAIAISRGPMDPMPEYGTRVEYAELRGVGMALERLPKDRPLEFLLDSTSAIACLQQWRLGAVDRVPKGYSIRDRTTPTGTPTLTRVARQVAAWPDIRFEHVKGHRGDPMNEVADSLANIARLATTRELPRDEAVITERASDLITAFLK